MSTEITQSTQKAPTKRRNLMDKLIKKRPNRGVVRKNVEQARKEIRDFCISSILIIVALTVFFSMFIGMVTMGNAMNVAVEHDRTPKSFVGQVILMPITLGALPFRLVAALVSPHMRHIPESTTTKEINDDKNLDREIIVDMLIKQVDKGETILRSPSN
jgi:hypothetical protein